MRTSQRVWFIAIMHLIVWFRFDRLFVECVEKKKELNEVCVTITVPQPPAQGHSSAPVTQQKHMTAAHTECIKDVNLVYQHFYLEFSSGVLTLNIKTDVEKMNSLWSTVGRKCLEVSTESELLVKMIKGNTEETAETKQMNAVEGGPQQASAESKPCG